jgi:hypothetical protein
MRRPLTSSIAPIAAGEARLGQGEEPQAPGDGESKGRVRMTTVDDRLPTKDLEVEVREPAWSTKVRLGPKSQRRTGARCP